MKARLPALSKNQQTKLRAEVAKEIEKQRQDLTRRLFKIFCAMLNQEFGFGKSRLCHLLTMVNELSNERAKDEVFWAHIDRKVIDEIGLDFSREDYDLMDE
jgi:hypothetical protein